MIVTGSDFRFIVTEQMSAIGITPFCVLIEPAGRNTAPAVLAAAFRAAVMAGVPAALSGQIVTFGIRPDRAETGYGWLELTRPAGDFAPVAQPLKPFVEKPDLARATQMLNGGDHLWNAGIFLFTTTTIFQAFADHAPDMLDPARAAVDQTQCDLSFTRLDPAEWTRVRDISIDYAVMEKAANLTVLPSAGRWSDLGGWEAVWRESGPDANGVVVSGDDRAIDCENSLLRSEAPGLSLVGVGLQNIVAVAMPDAVLIAHKDRAQDVKLAVETLKRAGRAQAEPFRATIAPGVGAKVWRSAPAFRSSASMSIPVPRCRCKVTTTAPNIGSWSRAGRG